MLSHREGPPRAYGRLSFEPDRGKTRCPESQGERWKRGLWWNCEPTSLPKGRGWKPFTYGRARQRSTRRVESACGNVDNFAFSCMIMQNTGV